MQRISTTVRLNRSVLQFDDASNARLEQYLAESASLLEGDPDPQEILGDLEQAVADQCMRRMRTGQSFVTLAELEPALEEIGSVQAELFGDTVMSTSVVALPPSMHMSKRPFGAVVSIAPSPCTWNVASKIPQNLSSLSQSTYSPVNRS